MENQGQHHHIPNHTSEQANNQNPTTVWGEREEEWELPYQSLTKTSLSVNSDSQIKSKSSQALSQFATGSFSLYLTLRPLSEYLKSQTGGALGNVVPEHLVIQLAAQ